MVLQNSNQYIENSPAEIRQRVISFYSNDEFGYIRRQGINAFISMSRNEEYEPKYVILCTPREFYQLYTELHPSDKIGFSTFCNLRPKCFVFVAKSFGTQSASR